MGVKKRSRLVLTSGEFGRGAAEEIGRGGRILVSEESSVNEDQLEEREH